MGPEKWNLPSFLAIIAQVGNIGPLVITLMQALCPRYYHQNAAIYSILLLGCSSCLLMSFFWDTLLSVGGTARSIPFFILWFVLSSVDCTSSVTFLPFMTTLPTMFLTTYFIGEGLSGFIPSIFALVQGAGSSECKNVTIVNATTNVTIGYEIQDTPSALLYTEEVFFGLLTMMMVLCSISFLFINQAPFAKKYHNQKYTVARSQMRTKHDGEGIQQKDDQSLSTSNTGSVSDGEVSVDFTSDQRLLQKDHGNLTRPMFVYCLVIIFLVNAVSNGVIPSVSSYVSLPYGQLPYHLSATLGSMANPLACFIAMFFPMKSLKGVGIITLLFSGLSVWLLVLALMSPCPYLVGTDLGAGLMVAANVLFVGIGSYIKISIAQIFRMKGEKKSLVWYGAAVQAGSMAGALIMFPMVNVYYFFQNGQACVDNCPSL